MVRWAPLEPQAAPLVAWLVVMVKADMRQQNKANRVQNRLHFQILAAARHSEFERVPARSHRMWRILSRKWLRLCDFTRDSLQQHQQHRHAAAKVSLYSPRAQCLEGPLGLASNTTDTRFFPAIWFMSIMPSHSRGPSMLPVGRSVLQRMRHDESPRAKKGNEEA